MDNNLENLQSELLKIHDRNARVEAEKAWETSFSRISLIAIATYGIASVVLYTIGVSNFYESALIPTIGYLLSTQSLPFIKKNWMRRYLEKSANR